MTSIKKPEIKQTFNVNIQPYVIKDNMAAEYYEDAKSNFWDVNEVDMSQDKNDIKKLKKTNPEVWTMLKMILTFFAGGDNVVIESLSEYFIKHPRSKMDRIYREFQIMIENIHMIMYGLAFSTYMSPHEQKEQLKLLKDTGVIVDMYKWALKWIDPSKKNIKKKHAKNLIVAILNEGIMFQGPFEIIYYIIAMFPSMIPGLEQFNELIARDETSHAKYSCFLYKDLKDYEKLSTEEVHAMFREAIDLHMAFMKTCLTDKKGNDMFDGLTFNMMKGHIEHMANVYLELIGEKKLYMGIKKTPLIFAHKRSLEVQTMFFEKKVTQYKRPDQDINGGFLDDKELNSFELTDDY